MANPEPAPQPDVPQPERFPRYPKALRDAERACLAHRHPGLAEPPGGKEPWLWKNKVGLALSGGGIRSATFSLGILQALAAPQTDEDGPPRLASIDILSTVSGGGYIGSFLGGLFQWRNVREGLHVDAAQGRSFDETARDLRDLHSPPLRFLRENGRYLTPGGSGDALRAAAVAGRNVLALHLVLATFALLAFLLLDCAAALGDTFNRVWGRSWYLGGLPVSGWFAVPGLVAVFVALPAAWGYWLAGSQGWAKATVPPWFTVTALGAAGLGVCLLPGDLSAPILEPLGLAGPSLMPLLAVEAGLALAFMGGAKAIGTFNTGSGAHADEAAEFSPRRRLTSVLRWSLLVILLGLYLAFVDSLALLLYDRSETGQWGVGLGASGAAFAALVARTQAIRAFFMKKLENAAGGKVRIPWAVVAGLLAAVLATAILVAVAYLAHGLGAAWGPLDHQDPARLGWCALVVLVLCLVFGRTFPFLNQSTLGPFYTTMLTRAYLGASNGLRHAQVESAGYVVDGDDLLWSDYKPHEHAGPLHLINVCLNETQGGESQVAQRDRKGMAMAVGPAGVSVGVRHHALWNEPLPTGSGDAFGVFQTDRPGVPFRPENLTVGQWMGISGAAVGTGMGRATSRSLAFLFGILNARLGHWWDGGIPPRRRYTRTGPRWFRPLRTAFSVQLHLLDELLAKFPGTATQRWYLSDGGHFENLAVYELLRRRLPFIIAVDSGADPASGLGDLENLVRLARVDLDAELRFLSEAELLAHGLGAALQEPSLLGPLDWLKRGPWEGQTAPAYDPAGFSRCHACLAEVTYLDDTPKRGWLLYIKPTLLKPGFGPLDLPLDVQKYHEHHPQFPHESTGDQFFNEAQWESYRRLGEHIGSRLLRGRDATGPNQIWDFCT